MKIHHNMMWMAILILNFAGFNKLSSCAPKAALPEMADRVAKRATAQKTTASHVTIFQTLMDLIHKKS